MAEHEPLDAAQRDDLSGVRDEARAARVSADRPAGSGEVVPNAPTDDAAAASEPMVLETTPEEAPVPPNRQRTGSPPKT